MVIVNDNSSAFDNGKLIITLDGDYESLFTIGFPLFVAQGVKATFYSWTDNIGAGGSYTWANMATMVAANMDMQCHGKSHTRETLLTALQLDAEIQAVDAAFVANGLAVPDHHAYPYGSQNATVIGVVDDYRLSGRTYSPNPIDTLYSDVNKYTMQSIGIDLLDEDGINAIKYMMSAAQTLHGAIILTAHGFDEAPIISITSAQMNELIDYGQSIGMDIITIDELYALLD